MEIYNEDCVSGSKQHFADSSIDLIVCDPPFGINETSFHKHYNRDENNIIQGYQEAPEDYYQFSVNWLEQAKRILKPNGSMYVVSGWSNLRHILNAIEDVGFYTINHLIWKFNFGVFTKNKYVSSHYHILFLKHNKNVKHKFNTYCRFKATDRKDNRSLNYQDLEDVFEINKQYCPGEVKNKNKLPDELIKKLIQYSSDEGDMVCDFFMGNFTTAIVGRSLNRDVCGFEINKEAFDLGYKRVAIMP